MVPLTQKMDTSIVWISAMRWKECQPIFKCHCLFLFWIPALLCATDLNWVNITCGAPVGSSVCVHVWVCACMCVNMCEWFKPRSCASYQTLTPTLRKGCRRFALSESQRLLNNYEWVFSTRNYCLSSPIRREHALSANCLSLLPCSLLERAAGGSVKRLRVSVCVCRCTQTLHVCLYCVHRWVFVHSVCLAMVYCSATVRQGLPCWSFQINRHW